MFLVFSGLFGLCGLLLEAAVYKQNMRTLGLALGFFVALQMAPPPLFRRLFFLVAFHFAPAQGPQKSGGLGAMGPARVLERGCRP